MKILTTLLAGGLLVTTSVLFYCWSHYQAMSEQYAKSALELEKATAERDQARRGVEKLQARIRALVKNPSGEVDGPRVAAAPKSNLKKVRNSSSPTESEVERQQRIAEMQVAAAGRILSLTEDERADLEEMYRNRQNEESSFQSLEEILGDERAATIREEQRKAFSRSELEDVERDAYYFARKFDLDDEQELRVLNALTEVQQRVKDERNGTRATSPRERMQQVLAEAKLYRRLMMQRMRAILSEQQMNQYMKYDQESSAADMELWHSPPEESKGENQ